MRGHVSAIHWGIHRASNDHRDIDQIATLGLLHYSPGSYFALACAAIGIVPKDLADLRLEDVRWGELQHHLLQAVCRSAIRKGDGQPCHAFVICTPSPQAHSRIQATFPGAKVVDWKLDQVDMGEVQNAAIDYLRERFADPEVQRVPKKEVMEHIGADAGHFARDILQAKNFKSALDYYGFVIAHHAFVRTSEDRGPAW